MTKFSGGESFTSSGIDRVGKKFAADIESRQAMRDVQKYREFRMKGIKDGLDILGTARLPDKCMASIRLKCLDSIHRKLNREDTNFKLSQLDDIIGFRIICPSVDGMAAARDSIDKLSQCFTTKDFTQHDQLKESGYRAVHHIIRFEQQLSDNQSIKARIEIQVRSYYQHMWATWSEGYGDNIKQGIAQSLTDKEKLIFDDLKELSERLAEWEKGNPSKSQDNGRIPAHDDSRTIAAVKRHPAGEITKHVFKDERVDNAVDLLHYWEEMFPHSRKDALLLMGLINRDKIISALSLTHPLIVLGRAFHPDYWEPKS